MKYTAESQVSVQHSPAIFIYCPDYILSIDLPDGGVNLVDNAGQEPSLYKCNSKPRYYCIFAYRVDDKRS